MTGLVLGWRRSQQRRSPGTAPSVWGGARNQPSGAEGGAGAEAQGGGRRKWCELFCHRLKLQQGKKKSLCEICVREHRKNKMEKEKCCELSTQRTRLNKGKKQIYVICCVRERGSARGRETNIMWTLVLGNRAHEGKVGNDVFVSGKKAHGSCVRLYALSRTMRQDHDSIGPLEPLLWQWRCLLMQSFVYFLCFEKFWHHFCSSAWYTFLLIIVAVGV